MTECDGCHQDKETSVIQVRGSRDQFELCFDCLNNEKILKEVASRAMPHDYTSELELLHAVVLERSIDIKQRMRRRR